jgi:large conductance mechanosensitive channel
MMMAEEEKKPEKKGFVAEFMEFLLKYQVIGLAVAVIIGAAATKMVTATVNDIIMPIIGAIIPGGSWREAIINAGPIAFLIGDFIGAIIDFVIIALVVFLVVKYMMKGDTSKKI